MVIDIYIIWHVCHSCRCPLHIIMMPSWWHCRSALEHATCQHACCNALVFLSGHPVSKPQLPAEPFHITARAAARNWHRLATLGGG
jgi:hypothetical protein